MFNYSQTVYFKYKKLIVEILHRWFKIHYVSSVGRSEAFRDKIIQIHEKGALS